MKKSIDNGNLPNLKELIETKILPNDWKIVDKNQVGEIVIEGELFNVIIEPVTIVDSLIMKLSFELIIDGKISSELVINKKNASKLMGSMIHSVIDKIDYFEGSTAIIFIASDNIDRRLSMYETVATRLMKFLQFNLIKPNFQVSSGRALVIYKEHGSFEFNQAIDQL